MRAPIFLPPVPPRKIRRRRSWVVSAIGWVFGMSVAFFLAGSAAAGYLFWQASKDLPDYDSLAKYEPPVMTRIHAHDGSLMAEYAREKRIFVPINTVPKLVIGAYISAEDKRFYEHSGVDFYGIGRAGMKYIERTLTGRGALQGASTITQQVAKNFLLDNKRELSRKLKEAVLAIRLERAYSKDKILELYLNHIDLGVGGHGVAAASLNYFGKELDQLTIEEAAYLAVLPKAPYGYHPIKHKQKATDRRNWVIDRMVDNGYITAEQGKTAKALELTVNFRPLGTQIYAAEYFAEEVRRTLVTQYGEDGLYGKSEWIASGDNRVNGGLSVRTTLDPAMQRYARRALIDGLVAVDREKGWRGAVQKIEVAGDWGVPLAAIEVPADILPWRLGVVVEVQRAKAVIGLRPVRSQDGKPPTEREGVELPYDEIKWANKKPSKTPGPSDVLSVGDVIWVAPKDPNNARGVWSLMQIPELSGGLIAMDPHTGRVLAVVGGFSFAQSQFDRAIQARRQPGSSFKPFVYAAALDNGYKPTSIVLDAPLCIEATSSSQQDWCPKNYEGDKSYGPQTLRTGIEKSRNQMTVRLTQDLGMPMVVEYAKRFGIYDDLLPVLAMSLGAGETTLLRMTAAYAVLANGGRQVRPTLVDRIQDRYGRTIWRHDERDCKGCRSDKPGAEPDLPESRRQILDPHTAFQMTAILEGAVSRGTGTRVKDLLPGVPVAGKTGTTNEEKDAWFVGYTPNLVVGVFIGYDTPRPMGKGRTGGALAAPIAGNFMKMVFADKRPVPFRLPDGIKVRSVNLKTGIRVSGDERADVISEYFKPYEEPDDAFSAIGIQGGNDGGFVSNDQLQQQRALSTGRGGTW